MRILYCHNYYRHRGGEDVSFELDVQRLRSAGHDVEVFTRDNHELRGGPLGTAARSLFNRATAAAIRERLTEFRPDVLHCNNLFPQITPSVCSVAAKLGVPVVMALRNYRSFCANTFFFRDGKVCTKCLGLPAAVHGIRHRCYRDSVSASAVVAAIQTHRRVARVDRWIDAYVTPSEFSRTLHVENGYPASKVFVRPNYIHPDLGAESPQQAVRQNSGAVFVGRLSKEKGVDTLIDAWQRHELDISLTIIGGGPETDSVREAAASDPRITMTGSLPTNEVLAHLAAAECLIMPSRWFETFGRTIAEAFSRGTPAIVSDLGAMAELVDPACGWKFPAGDAEALADRVHRLRGQSETERAAMRSAARARYESRFSWEQSYRRLLRCYRQVFENRGIDLLPVEEAESAMRFEHEPHDGSGGRHRHDQSLVTSDVAARSLESDDLGRGTR